MATTYDLTTTCAIVTATSVPTLGTSTASAHIGSGGMTLNGVGTIGYFTPSVTAVIGAGGMKFNGVGVINVVMPTAVIGAGGFKWGGTGVITSKEPTAVVGSGGYLIAGDGIIGGETPLIPAQIVVPDWLSDLLGLPGITSPGFKMGGAGIINVAPPPVLAIVGSGGFVLGLFQVPELVIKGVGPALTPIVLQPIETFMAPGGLEMGGEGVIVWSSPPPVYAVPVPGAGEEASIRLGGRGVVAWIDPQIMEVFEAGELIIGGEPMDPGVFDTYSLFGARDEPSIYSGYSFNSYARLHGRYYGAGPAGISLLEGEDDAGQKIHAGLRLNPFNVGTEREKRIRIVRCGGETRGAQVKVSSNGHANYANVHDSVAAVDRSVQGRELVLEITDFKELNHLEIVPMVLAKR